MAHERVAQRRSIRRVQAHRVVLRLLHALELARAQLAAVLRKLRLAQDLALRFFLQPLVLVAGRLDGRTALGSLYALDAALFNTHHALSILRPEARGTCVSLLGVGVVALRAACRWCGGVYGW